MKKIILSIFSIVICLQANSQAKLHQSLGSINGYSNKEPYVLFNTSTGHIRISAYSPVCIRVQINKSTSFEDFSYAVQAKPVAGLINVTDKGSAYELRTDSCYLVITKNPARIALFNHKGELLNEDEPAFGTGWIGEEVSTYKKMQDDEKFIGLGEKTGNLNRRGEGFTNWNTDYFAYPSNGDPIYASIPFYMGVHHNVVYGLFLDNTYKSHFNFGASNNRFSSFTAEDGEMNYYLFASATVAGIIESYT
ncbi:MAG: glycoside hydrolase family 31, partial [Bacteroidota bacterium]